MRTAILLTLLFLETVLSPGLSVRDNSDRVVTSSDVGKRIPAAAVAEQKPDAQPQPQATDPSMAANGPAAKDWRSPENEVELGRNFAGWIEASFRMIQDPVTNNYVNGIAQKLAPACGAPFSISIKIIETDLINAIALPGGFVYISSSLVDEAEDESELAAMISHQMAHSCAHQLVRGMSREEFRRLTTPVRIIVNDKYLGFSGPVPFTLPPLTQDFPPNLEAEADILALQYMYKAGYDPDGLLTLFARLESLEKSNSDALSKTFLSHIQTPIRINAAKKRIKSFPRKDQYTVDTSEFDVVKARLLILMARRRSIITGPKQPHR